MKQKQNSTVALKVEHYEVGSVDGKKFGRAWGKGLLEILYFENEVRLKLMHSDIETPISDVMVPMDAFKAGYALLIQTCTKVAQWDRDLTSGSLVRTANLGVAI